MTSVPGDVEVVPGALTSVRKRDWQRLVAAAVAGTTIRLTDADLPRDVVFAAIDPEDETIVAHSPGGPTLGRTLTGWDAARARGQRTLALLAPLVAVLEQWIEDEDPEGLPRVRDAARAWTYIVGIEATSVPVDELTAAHGRSVLRQVANLTPTADDVDSLMAHVATGRPDEAIVMTAWNMDDLAFTTFTDEGGIVAQIRWLPGVWRDAFEHTTWRAWTDAQAGHPWDVDRIVDAVADAVAGAGLTARPAAGPEDDG